MNPLLHGVILLLFLCFRSFQIRVCLFDLLLLRIHIALQDVHIGKQAHELIVIIIHLCLKAVLRRLDILNLLVHLIQFLLCLILLILCILDCRSRHRRIVSDSDCSRQKQCQNAFLKMSHAVSPSQISELSFIAYKKRV